MGLGVDPFSNYNGNSWSTVATPKIDITSSDYLKTNFLDSNGFFDTSGFNDSLKSLNNNDRYNSIRNAYIGGMITDNDYTNAMNQYNVTNPNIPNKKEETSSGMSGMDIANATFQGLSALTSAGTSIANSVLGWKNYAQNKKLINKQIDAINEQITASQEYRQQRKDEIARLNRVRSNTQKSFNTGTTITRSY